MQSSQNQSQSSMYREEAIPFVVYNPDQRKFELTNESVEFLKNVPAPLGLVSVAGMYRTGKSYLLNRMLLGRSNGFGVGPSINPCTKGLWIWGKPIAGFTPDNEPINILIVDTEGLGAIDEDSNHDVRIFSMAILLSSYFIYNSVGSIDESALSNLSLVINLTKHIHIKSKGGNDEIDTEEYGTYFPTFMWVVRDFTLQLVDNDGEPITSKDYFEKALELQKGFSDNVEQKNRIRRLLKSFFKERDCCTMIRPLTNEEDLQNLANMDLDELRADFVEQVMQLRRKVINRIKPKMLNGKKLSGSMMGTMAQAYVVAINNGAIPNIENAWNYICKNECGKAIEEALIKFEEVLKENVISKIPMEEDELKESYADAKKEAKIMFHKKAVGNMSEEYIKELKVKMQQIYFSLQEENERQSIQQSQICLANCYQQIEKKLKNKEYQGGLIEYEQDIKQFQQQFLEFGPPGPHKRLIMHEFVQRAYSDAAEYFHKSIQNELDLQKAISGEHFKSLETNIKEMKGDYQKEKEKLEQNLRALEVQKVEFSAVEQNLKEQLEKMQSDKLQLEFELMGKNEQQRKQMLNEIEEYKNKLAQSESISQDMQRKVFTSESESEKEKALLEQKIDFLERSIQDYQKKETEYTTDLKTQKKDQQSLLREMQSKYEAQIRQLNTKFEETNEKYLELQSQFEEIQNKYSFDKKQWAENQENLKSSANINQSQFSEMQKQLEDLKIRNRTEVEKYQNELFDIKQNWQMKEEELSSSVKEKDEEIKTMKNKFEKEMAIFKQKLEFKEVQGQQLLNQLNESKKTHDSMVKAMENRTRESLDGKDLIQRQFEDMKNQHNNEIRQLEKEYTDSRQILEDQINQLNTKNNDLELTYKLTKSDLEKDNDSLRQQLEQSEILRQKAVDQSKNTDSQKIRLLEDTEERYKYQINSLEKELEEIKFKAEQNIKDLQNKSEDSFVQLKNFYEIDKKRFEQRLADEKERDQKKLNAQQEDFESRLRYEQQQHEEDVDMLQEELRDKECRYQAIQYQLEHDNQMLLQKMETLEQQKQEISERLSKVEDNFKLNMDQQLEKFTIERKELLNKIETYISSISSKDREISILKSKLESQIEDLEKKKKYQDEIKNELTQEKQKLNEKIEQLRNKNQQIQDEYIQKKLEDARELALYKQKLEFQQKKIEDMQKQQDEVQQRYEQRIQQQKVDFQQEMQEMIVKMNATKETVDSKYDQKRRWYKEQEILHNKQMIDIQREKAVLEEKTVHLEQTKEELRIKLESEIVFLKEQLGSSSESLSKERDMLIHETDRLKQLLQDIEKDYSEIQSSYERDKALWDGKFQFLEQQKELAKSDLQEATKKFEMTLEQLHKRGSTDKDKFEQSQNFLLGTIEQKYKVQIKEQIENNQKSISELNERNKNLEKENRQLQSRLQLEQRDKLSDHGSMEKKIADLQENESKLQQEIDILKSERDKKILENQKNIEKEKETFKQKLEQLEQKNKEIETKRTCMLFEHQTEINKINSERENALVTKKDIQDQLDQLMKKHEFTIRENEKLKNEKANRKQNMYGGLGSSTALGQNPSGIQSSFASKFGQNLLKSMTSKENVDGGVSQSQAFNLGFPSKYLAEGSHQSSSDKQGIVTDNQSNKEVTPNKIMSGLQSAIPSFMNSKIQAQTSQSKDQQNTISSVGLQPTDSSSIKFQSKYMGAGTSSTSSDQ